MRLFKMLGLAVVSALAAMAFVGVGTASADSFCEDGTVNHNTGTCPAGSRLANGTPFLGLTTAGAPWTLLAGAFEVKCHSTFLVLIDSNEGAHVGLWALVDTLTFTSCSGSCSGADGLGEQYLLLFAALELHAVLTKHVKGGALEILLTGCALGDCKYALTVPTLLDVVGDTLVAKEEPITRTAGLCPATGKMDATYLLTLEAPNTNVPLYLVALP